MIGRNNGGWIWDTRYSTCLIHLTPRATVHSALAGSGGVEGLCIEMSRSWLVAGSRVLEWKSGRRRGFGRGSSGVRRWVLLVDWSLVIAC